MGKFMLAHLQDGEYNGVRILQPETARLMHSQSYTFDPALTGIAHGFMEWTINGRRLIGHGGDLDGFVTEMRLIPEERVGFFVCYNSYIGKMADRTRCWKPSWIATFQHRPRQSVADLPGGEEAASHLARFTGFYISSRYNTLDSSEKFFALTDMMLVRSGPGNTLLFPGVLLQQLSPYVTDSWVEVGPRVFQNTRTGDLYGLQRG